MYSDIFKIVLLAFLTFPSTLGQAEENVDLGKIKYIRTPHKVHTHTQVMYASAKFSEFY